MSAQDVRLVPMTRELRDHLYALGYPAAREVAAAWDAESSVPRWWEAARILMDRSSP